MPLLNQCCCGTGLYFQHLSTLSLRQWVRLAHDEPSPPPLFVGDVADELRISSVSGEQNVGYDSVRKLLLWQKASGAIWLYNRKGQFVDVLWDVGTDAASQILSTVTYHYDWGMGSATNRATSSGTAQTLYSFDDDGNQIQAINPSRTVPSHERFGDFCCDDNGDIYYVGAGVGNPFAPYYERATRVYKNGSFVGHGGSGFEALTHNGTNLHCNSTKYWSDGPGAVVSFVPVGTETIYPGYFQVDLSGAFGPLTPIIDIRDIPAGTYTAPRIERAAWDGRKAAMELYLVCGGSNADNGFYSVNLSLTRNIWLSKPETNTSVHQDFDWIVMKPD